MGSRNKRGRGKRSSRRNVGANVTAGTGAGMTRIVNAANEEWRGYTPPANRGLYEVLPPIRRWVILDFTVTAGATTVLGCANLFASSVGTNVYRYVRIHRVAVYTARISNSNTFDFVTLLPQAPSGVVASSATFEGVAPDIYKRAVAGYIVPFTSALSGPFLPADSFASAITASTEIEVCVECSFFA